MNWEIGRTMRKKIPMPRLQLLFARRLYQRPYQRTVDAVREEANAAYFSGSLSRDELEVLEILLETIERGLGS